MQDRGRSREPAVESRRNLSQSGIAFARVATGHVDRASGIGVAPHRAAFCARLAAAQQRRSLLARAGLRRQTVRNGCCRLRPPWASRLHRSGASPPTSQLRQDANRRGARLGCRASYGRGSGDFRRSPDLGSLAGTRCPGQTLWPSCRGCAGLRRRSGRLGRRKGLGQRAGNPLRACRGWSPACRFRPPSLAPLPRGADHGPRRTGGSDGLGHRRTRVQGCEGGDGQALPAAARMLALTAMGPGAPLRELAVQAVSAA